MDTGGNVITKFKNDKDILAFSFPIDIQTDSVQESAIRATIFQ